MKRIRYFLSLAICLVLCLETVCGPLSLCGLQAFAAEGNYYRINGKNVNAVSADGSSNNAYAKEMFRYIWDTEYSGDFVSSDNILKNIAYAERELTPDYLKQYVSRSIPGAVLRVETLQNGQVKTENGSEFILAAYDANGLFVFEKTAERQESYYTWLDFCAKYAYTSIRFIKWPGSYFATDQLMSETDFVKPDRVLYFDTEYLLSGDDVRWVQQRLSDVGYDVSVDGQYSRNTETAVKAFQRDFEIQPTGVVDSMTADLLEKPMKVPDALKLELLTDKDIARGDVLTVAWEAVDYAESYHIDLYNTRGNLIDSFDGITGTKVSFVIGDAGTYIVKGFAQNEFYAGDESTLDQRIKVHNMFSVTFVDEDGTVLNRQKVAYGQSAAAPASPKKIGHSFTGWDKPFSRITETTTLTAQYTPKLFTVTFKTAGGSTIATQSVRYGESATAPDMSSVTGFAGWNKDFSFVEDSMTVTAVVINSANTCYIEISGAAAVREADSSGYTVTLTATNTKTSTVVVRAVVALKTASEKFLTLTESSAFKINAATSTSTYSKTISVFVPYTYTATVAEVYVIENYEKPVPVSAVTKITSISTTNNYTDYLASAPAEHYGLVDSRTEYKYRTKSYKTSSASSMSGWTKYDMTVARGSAGGWSGWSDSPISEITKEGYKVREVQTQTVSWVSGIKSRYWMTHAYAPEWRRHYWNYKHGEEIAGNGVHYGDIVFSVNEWDNMTHVVTGANTYPRTYWGYNKVSETGRCYSQANDGVIWYKYGENTSSKKQYRYRDYDLIYTYYYYRWGDWSNWSPNAVTATNDRQVQTRTTSRYKVNNPYEDNSGKKRTIAGIVDKSLAGKQATLFIYKAGDASDYSNEFIGQCVIGKDGTYSFTFKMREEPSTQTGDYTVVLGVEGANTVFYLDKILAPLPVYTVRFCDDDGTVLSTQLVTKGDSAVLPVTNPSKDGYTFAGWTYSNASIFQDTDIRALYVENEYTITFIDWTNQMFEMHTGLHYGDPVLVPELNYNALGLTPVCWDGITDGMTVTGNMVVTAKYDQKEVTVNFFDCENNIISTQTVQYGGSVVPPEWVPDDDYIFLAWDKSSFDNITLDTNVYPVFCFSQTCHTPDADLESGVYNDSIRVILSCPTENSVIYYTVNDGETQIYTAPITISETAELTYYAGSLGYNDSSICRNYYAINRTGNEQAWQYPVSLYDGDSLLSTFFVAAGATIKDAVPVFEKDGYVFEGYYTDRQFRSEWDVETSAVQSATALYAKYSPALCIVQFRYADGRIIDTQTVPYLGAAAEPAQVSVAADEKFIRWDRDDYKCVTEDTVVTAVIRNVQDIAEITLNKEKLTTLVGMCFELVAAITPASYANKTVIWKSSNTDVVTVNSEGMLTAVGTGSAVVTATLLADEAVSAGCIVTVQNNKSEKICLKDGSALTLSKGYLVGVIPAKNTVQEILAEIDGNCVAVYASNGAKLDGADRVESGAELRIEDNAGKVLDRVVVITAGDVFADGLVNNKDASMLLRKTVDKETFTDVQKIAGDVNADGFVSVKDVSLILQYIKGMETVLSK